MYCEDHKGNKFPTKIARAEKYGLPESLVKKRLRKGWSLEDALTTPNQPSPIIQPKPSEDHDGNIFNSEKAMAEAYGLNVTTFKRRLSLGWSLKDALTTPIKERRNVIEDHRGNIFESKEARAKEYGLPVDLIDMRLDAGWGLERTLTTPVKNTIYYYDDIYGDFVPSKSIMERYNTRKHLSEHYSSGYKISQIVGVSMIISSRFIYINQTKYNLTVSKRIKKGKDVFECYIDNGDGTSTFKIMSYDMIDQYCIEQYKKIHNIA